MSILLLPARSMPVGAFPRGAPVSVSGGLVTILRTGLYPAIATDLFGSSADPNRIRAGADFRIKWSVKDAAGTPVDLSDATFNWFALEQGGSSRITKVDADFDKSLASTGVLYLTIARADSLGLGGKNLNDELWRVDSGVATPIDCGVFEFLASANPAP